ncbi:hypothetical protein CUMW_179200 [Citrus unshiu]|uniref:Protein kinase domain-containing protein n=1 Tax=Citrus unshiu TaxID=55188 RepID=A0A2H5PYF8_CITUN|nr:hypothetical protein CUMW_179200 [Citrus unshiu]
MALCTGQTSLFMCNSKNREKADRKAFLMRNGKMFLERLISSCNGNYNPIRSFSAKELERATNNYHYRNIITESSIFRLCQGVLPDRTISVMKFIDGSVFDAYDCCFNNIVFASQMSHNNVLRLIGCCLEVEIPVLVFESAEYGNLHDLLKRSYQSHSEPLLLKHRLKIAMEIANVFAYLHIGFSRPIVFRDLKSSYILVSERYVPKLFNFSLSASIPEGETYIDDGVKGTSGIVAPEYACTGYLNEKCDVYSFGLLLLQLLSTGEDLFNMGLRLNGDESFEMDFVKKYIENRGFNGIVDPRIIGDELLEHKLQSSFELAFQCQSASAEDRPTMIDVAKQIKKMYKSF